MRKFERNNTLPEIILRNGAETNIVAPDERKMAASCKQGYFILSLTNSNRLGWREIFRTYAQFSKIREKPVFNKSELEKYLKSEKGKGAELIPRLPPLNGQTCSVFHDDIKNYFINCMLRKGEKETCRTLFDAVLTDIKHGQLRKYNAEKDEAKKKEIVLDPMEVFRTALNNVTPLLTVTAIKKSGKWYRVPVAVTPKYARFMALRWIIQSSKVGHEVFPIKENLTAEILKAFNYEGNAIQKKLELHKLCEANRSYAHYQWT